MTEEKLRKEFKETRKFLDFVEGTGRLEQIEYIDRYLAKETQDCIHVLDDFSTTAAQKHPGMKEHLKRLDESYEPYREHALKCKRCQASLDAIFTFKGYENRVLFPEIIQKILEKEWEIDSDKSVYLCKLPAPGLSYSELTYITSLPLTKAIEGFREKIKEPLKLPKFLESKYRKKKSNKGMGIDYVQAYLYPEDHRHKTKICIRSRIK